MLESTPFPEAFRSNFFFTIAVESPVGRLQDNNHLPQTQKNQDGYFQFLTSSGVTSETLPFCVRLISLLTIQNL